MGKYVNKFDKSLMIKLDVRVDASLAPVYMDELKEYTGQGIEKIVLFAKDTEYLSSAGIRVILFAKQKISPNVEVYLVDPKEFVIDTLKLTGILDYIKVVDESGG